MEGRGQYKRGLWTAEEDKLLTDYISLHGKGGWNRIAKLTGLKRCGKSCRLRWINYLCPNVNRADFTEQEEDLIMRLHKLLGNRWSLIAGRVPGRTDNQIKNHWNTRLSRKLGVKNGKRRCSAVLPKPSRDIEEETEVVSGDSRVPSFDNGETMEVAVNEASHGAVESSNTLELPSTESLVDSFWFSDDNNSLGNSSLVDFSDVYALDMIWHDL